MDVSMADVINGRDNIITVITLNNLPVQEQLRQENRRG